jgi:hypothetical protein
MKMKSLLLRAGVAAVVLAGVLAPAAAAAKDPFIGHWKSVDPFDDSNQSIAIGGGPGDMYHALYMDAGASLCGTDPTSGAPLYAAVAQGFLTLSDGALAGDLNVYCLDAAHTDLGPFPFSFTDNGNSTLTDGVGTIWSH